MMQLKKTHIITFIIIYSIFFTLYGFRKQVPSQLEGEFAVFSRPYTFSDIKSAFVGPWLPSGEKDSIRYFYRPFAIVAYKYLYHLFGHDIYSLHLARQLFSVFKLAAFYGIMCWLTNRSLSLTFFATLLYAISFKIFDEQVVFQCLPDILATTVFFAALFFYILFSNRQYNKQKTIGLGVSILLLFVIGLGTKECALFLLPTLLTYRVIYTCWQRPFSKIHLIFDRKHAVLFSAMLVVLIVYFTMRYYSLGRQYLLMSPYQDKDNWLIVVMLNILNNFAFFPITYVDRSMPLSSTITLGKCLLNMVIPFCAGFLLLSKNVDNELRKGVLFSLILILLNTFFYTQIVRLRFNSISNLGGICLLVVVVEQIIHRVRIGKNNKYYHPLIFAMIAACLCMYAIQNAVNILDRQHPNFESIYPSFSSIRTITLPLSEEK